MTEPHPSRVPPFHLITGALTPAFGHNGEHLGALVATLVHAASGETQYAVLVLKNHAGGRALVPVPWAILEHYRSGERCVADVDRRKLATAPHYSRAELDHFDTGLACLIDGAYGLEFPGIEGLNDLA